jgi:hypothetical protein
LMHWVHLQIKAECEMSESIPLAQHEWEHLIQKGEQQWLPGEVDDTQESAVPYFHLPYP